MIDCPDQMGNAFQITRPAKRIVSLVPSLTETLYDLGCRSEVIGITKFCIHPELWFREKQRIGGTKTVDLEKVKALKPDLILANKEENDPEQVKALMKLFPVWVSDLKNTEDAISMIQSLGKLTDKNEAASDLCSQINSALAAHQANISDPKKVAYLIWKKPMMVAGGDTYINSMIELTGWENAFKDRSRYPQISEEELKSSGANLILLSSEPFPFREKHVKFFQNICPTAVINMVDGTYFSWYGSRLLPAIRYFANLRR